MFSSFTLLLPCLMAVLPSCHGKPLPAEINWRNPIITISKRIQKDIEENPMSNGLSINLPDQVPGTKPIQGLGSAIESLTAFERITDTLWGSHHQLSVDLNNLVGSLRNYMVRVLQCPTRKPSSFEDLDSFLKSNQQYVMTLRPAVLRRLRDYMNKLLSNLNTLRTC
ncbi:leptin a [Sardina pilchardus]|uniref:leptin a n=1 Tax=Sardina pilchardus TaxID=27697 RepID=UPI002E11DE49